MIDHGGMTALWIIAGCFVGLVVTALGIAPREQRQRETPNTLKLRELSLRARGKAVRS